MTLTVLDEALQAATDAEEPILREVFRRAGLLWQCKNAECREDNPRGTQLCDGCGFTKAGCRIGEDYPAPIVDHAVRRKLAIARFQEASERAGARA